MTDQSKSRNESTLENLKVEAERLIPYITGNRDATQLAAAANSLRSIVQSAFDIGAATPPDAEYRGPAPKGGVGYTLKDAPRFFMDHGMIHDRVTGQHVHTQDDVEADATERLFKLLTELSSAARSETQPLEFDQCPDGKPCRQTTTGCLKGTCRARECPCFVTGGPCPLHP